MDRLPFASPTARDLARLMLAWLAAVLLAQSMAAAQGLVLGARHRHIGMGSMACVASAASVAFGAAPQSGPHDEWQRHVHIGADTASAVLSDDAQELAATAAIALAALAALPACVPSLPAWRGGQVMAAPPLWAARLAGHSPPERPPRC